MATAATPFPGSLIGKALRDIRTAVNEPTILVAYSDATLIDLLVDAWDECWPDMMNMADAPIISRFNLTTVTGQAAYYLPPNMAEFHRAYSTNSVTGLPDWEVIPRSKFHFGGPRLLFEGQGLVRMLPIPPQGGDTITIEYVPGPGASIALAFVKPTSGTASDAKGFSTTTGPLPTPTDEGTSFYLGQQDHRPNWAIGHYVRLLSAAGTGSAPSTASAGLGSPTGFPAFPIQERTISAVAYSGTQPTYSVGVAFDFNPGTDSGTVDHNIVYEIVPTIDRQIWKLMSYHVGRNICLSRKAVERFKMLDKLYTDCLRSTAIRLGNYQMRTGDYFDTNNVDADRSPFSYFGQLDP